MISVSKAIAIIKKETAASGSTESVHLVRAVGRVLAQDIEADTDMPPFDRSQMDGYAMKAKDVANVPARLKIVGESAAGRGWYQTLRSGEAIRIMTGARVPAGADSIQKIELTSESDETVTVKETTTVGKYIVRKGTEIRKGERLFVRGEMVDEKMVASLAAFGYSSIDVSPRPRVSILGTGTEIVPIGRKPGIDQIRNSNSAMLRALCERSGARAKILAQTGDDLKKLNARIGSAVRSGCDILVITGGVSVGKYDLTKAALHELGAELRFEKVRLRPGKPTVFGRLDRTLIFGLPGNPVSAAVTYYLFVRTAILKMLGSSDLDLPRRSAVLTATARAARERDTYLPAAVSTDNEGRFLASPMRWHGSSDFVGFARAEALIYVPRGEVREAGSIAEVRLI